MADFDQDPLTGAFDDFRREVAPFVRSTGVAATRATVRARKRNHVIALGVLGALVIAIPAAAYATVGSDPNGPPPPVAATPLPASTAADGRIDTATLNSATLDLPAWAPDARRAGCPSGPVKFTKGAHSVADSQHVWIDKAVYTDVDHDGANEAVVQFSCGDQESTYQVVAFDRDAAGQITTIGQVAVQTGAVTDICDLRAGDNGAVEVQVFDFPMPLRCKDIASIPARYITKQWRSFAWNGSAFAQNGGPQIFPRNPYASDLAISATDLVMTRRASDGHYLGQLTITVSNKGQSPIPYVTTATTQAVMQLTAPAIGCTTEFATSSMTTTCQSPSLAAGASRSVTLEFEASARFASDFRPEAIVRPGPECGDPNDGNDVARFDVKY